MSTLPPPAIKKFPEDSIEKLCYGIAESLKEYLPIPNDRNRLGFNLYRLAIGEGDKPEVIVKNAKLKVEGISLTDLAKRLEEEMSKIKKN
ncbi:MAG: hypothetical protein FD143_2808 [Ignavibacteria bacterium]|nr:MAG: hypothetical protein FD143_2808 [Ignavibacteria bacterium]KAF0160184.1 MAG: hypothetical protein FD188_1998 [Ignavibacteria bacterium]